MAESRIQSLPEEDALHQIVETIQQAEAGAAPFALVLGSGFSHGLVPTARQLVEESLPLWVKSLNEGEPFEPLIKQSPDQRNQVAREFWKQFVAKNSKREGFDLQLDSRTGLADDYSAAYRAAFDPNYTGAVGEPAQARKFQRALMRLDQPRLNAAHFLLASLLGVQPGKSRENDLFQARAAFSRLILTTNFDPFLQTALQAVNRLYFMSDTPELGVTDEILDDQTDAIHLVYLHGSIHRRSQAATDNDIKAIKERNARTLAPVLKRHGVIVLGYSGWDDAIVEALAACDRFDHRLYWCGRESDPLSKGAFGPRVVDILRKPSALYVKIDSAGHFMAQLCTRLVKGIPRLLDNPIEQLREMLDTIDLKDLEPVAVPVISGAPRIQPLDGRSNPEVLVIAQRLTIQRLIQAEQLFRRPDLLPSPDNEELLERSHQGEAQPDETEPRVRQLLSSAELVYSLGNYKESHNLCTKALSLYGVDVAEKARLFMTRALACYYLGKKHEAISDWTKMIQLPELPVEQVARALVNRGFVMGEKGEIKQSLDDYTRVIELPAAPVELVAQALVNRGIVMGEKGEIKQSLDDYTRVIELPAAPVELVAQALVNRGWVHYQRNAYPAFFCRHGGRSHQISNLGFCRIQFGASSAGE